MSAVTQDIADNGQHFSSLAQVLTDDDIYEGLDPVLAAHLRERVEADPSLRATLAVAALGRLLGWEENQ